MLRPWTSWLILGSLSLGLVASSADAETAASSRRTESQSSVIKLQRRAGVERTAVNESGTDQAVTISEADILGHAATRKESAEPRTLSLTRRTTEGRPLNASQPGRASELLRPIPASRLGDRPQSRSPQQHVGRSIAKPAPATVSPHRLPDVVEGEVVEGELVRILIDERPTSESHESLLQRTVPSPTRSSSAKSPSRTPGFTTVESHATRQPRTASRLNLHQPSFPAPQPESLPKPDSGTLSEPGTFTPPRPGAELFDPPTLSGDTSWCAPSEHPACCQGCSSCTSCCPPEDERWIDNFSVAQSMDGFKGPLDLNAANGNFGTRTTLNSSFAILPDYGFGAQIGSAVGVYDFKGTPFTGASARFQSFTTVGLFQRVLDGRVQWGVAYDFLYDAYYTRFDFGQWRAKAGWWINPVNEIGLWGTVHGYGDQAVVAPGGLTNHFRPITQGNAYWQHLWRGGTSTQGWFGVSERPGEFVFGADAFAPLNRSLALVGNFNYITSRNGPNNGNSRAEEFWNVSFGVAWYPGASTLRAARNAFRPFLPVADNGSFAVTRDR